MAPTSSRHSRWMSPATPASASPGVRVVVNNQPLAVAIVSPTSGFPVKNQVTVAASPSEPVARVEFRAGSGPVVVDDTAPYEVTLDISAEAEGNLTLTVTAIGLAPETASATRSRPRRPHASGDASERDGRVECAGLAPRPPAARRRVACQGPRSPADSSEASPRAPCPPTTAAVLRRLVRGGCCSRVRRDGHGDRLRPRLQCKRSRSCSSTRRPPRSAFALPLAQVCGSGPRALVRGVGFEDRGASRPSRVARPVGARQRPGPGCARAAAACRERARGRARSVRRDERHAEFHEPARRFDPCSLCSAKPSGPADLSRPPGRRDERRLLPGSTTFWSAGPALRS